MDTPIAPLVALVWFTALAAVALGVFWPRVGVVARLHRLVRQSERVRLEDALKHLYDCEYYGRTASADSLAGALELGRMTALRLASRLEARGLAASPEGQVELTDAGREYALRILRTHRLWERYLADRTGVRAEDWHDRAEEQEHRLSASETERLARSLGQPLYDPHGDPIPTAAGELPARSGAPLSSLDAGTQGVITHLEDEPREVFERLVRIGLTPLMPVERLESEGTGVRFRAGGRTHELPPMVAAHVTVDPRRGAEPAPTAPPRTLAELDTGEEAVVVRISPSLQGPQRRRLLDLGVVPGTVIRARLRSASGDPVAYEIREALIALRRDQAKSIQVAGVPEREAV